MQRRHFEVLADTLASAYQFHVEPFQKPEQYATRFDTWRGTVETITATLNVNYPNFNRDKFIGKIAKLTGLTQERLT